MNKKLVFCLKIGFLLIILTLIYVKADIALILKLLKQIDIIWTILAIIILFFSFIFSGMRLRVYLNSNNINCSKYFSIALCFVGMLYNNILPGGIGGDAYKIYKISKLYEVPKLSVLRMIVSDRANGLLALILLTLLLTFYSDYIKTFSYSHIVGILSIIITVITYILIETKILKEKFNTVLKAFKYSILVQFFCLISAVFILKALRRFDFNDQRMLNYLIIFMISSIIAIIPFSVGGAGLRELTFLYGSKYLDLDADVGIVFAFVYFCINLLLSTTGMVFMHNLDQINDYHRKEK